MSIDDLFGPTGDVTWAQECARAVVIFVYGLLVVRIAGRRVFAQWTALDIIIAITTGSTLSRAMTGSANLFGSILATTLLLILHWALAHASARWPAWSRVLEGPPVRLAQDGRIDHQALLRHAVSPTALAEALRGAGLDSPKSARLIVLEPSGAISVIKDQ